MVVADMLHDYGVSHIFMVPAVLRRSFAELERRHPEVARIATHGEKAAAYMADGFGRAARRPGICAAQVVGAPQPGGGPARAVPGRLPRDRLLGRQAARDPVPSRVPGGRRPARLRSGHEIQRRRRPPRSVRRHDQARVSRRHDRDDPARCTSRCRGTRDRSTSVRPRMSRSSRANSHRFPRFGRCRTMPA